MWAVDQSIKHVNKVCPSREKWTWDRLISSGSKNKNPNNDDNNKTNNNNYSYKNLNEKKQDIKSFNQKNIEDKTIDLSVAANVNCCHIKIQVTYLQAFELNKLFINLIVYQCQLMI